MLFKHPFPRDRSFVPSPNDARRQLVDTLTAFFSQAPRAFRCEADYSVAYLVEGEVSWASILFVLARLGSRRSWFIVASAAPRSPPVNIPARAGLLG